MTIRKLVVGMICLFSLNTYAGVRSLDVLVHQAYYGNELGFEEMWVGRKGVSRSLEAITITVGNYDPFNPISLEYSCHIEGIGTFPWVSGGVRCGTTGQSKRLEGFAIRISSNVNSNYSVRYKCHIAGQGDSDWKRDGEFCGTQGQSRGVESIYVEIIPKSS